MAHPIYILFSGYVNVMRDLLFSLPKEAMEDKVKQYKERAPEPLNRQFPERLERAAAIKKRDQRREAVTQLHPPGNKGIKGIHCNVVTLQNTALQSVNPPLRKSRCFPCKAILI